LDIVLLTEVL